MSKFAKTARPARPHGPTVTTTVTRTHEGSRGYALDERTELFTLATASFFGEDSFYETGSDRADRFVKLVTSVAATREGADWLGQFIPWLRTDANIRTGAIVAAVEYARCAHPEAATSGRKLLASTLSRGDEPAEALAYFISRYGNRRIPAAVKRGLADAATKLYTEYSLAKYDPREATTRPADVIALTRPKPKAPWQSDLFTYITDVRHNRADPRVTELLPLTAALRAWHREPSLQDVPELITWEQLSSHFTMDARAWEAAIPRMGYMALLRNLRNFEEKGVSPTVLDAVASRLADPEEVARSRQLPFRFWSAFKNVSGTRFMHPLELALEASLINVPEFPNRTLILVDTSASMQQALSAKSSITKLEAGALFGAAVGRASGQDGHICLFATGAEWLQNVPISVLRTVEKVNDRVGAVGHGTAIDQSLRWALNAGHTYSRIFIFTDMQAHPSSFAAAKLVPTSTPIHVWDLGGYGRTFNIELGSGRYLHAGLSDQSFKTVKLLESYKPGVWPWEATV